MLKEPSAMEFLGSVLECKRKYYLFRPTCFTPDILTSAAVLINNIKMFQCPATGYTGSLPQWTRTLERNKGIVCLFFSFYLQQCFWLNNKPNSLAKKMEKIRKHNCQQGGWRCQTVNVNASGSGIPLSSRFLNPLTALLMKVEISQSLHFCLLLLCIFSSLGAIIPLI